MSINKNNYEEWMVDFVEGNLSPAQKRLLSEFLSIHPELRAELDVYSQTTLEPDKTVAFTNKDVLKKKETDRVIVMASWIKYSAAIAATLLLFLGIRFFTVDNSKSIAVEKYKQPEIIPHEADRKTDSTIMNSEKASVHEIENYYAEQENELRNDSNNVGNQPEKTIHYQMREVEVEKGVEFANAQAIELDIEAEIELSDIIRQIEIDESEYAQDVIDDESENISLNDNNTVVDWFNDAMTMQDEMGSAFGFKKQNNMQEESQYKTRKIEVFGFNFYSRRKINN